MGRSKYVPLRCLGDVPLRRHWLFETCLKRRGDVLMGRRHYVPMKRHHDISVRRREDLPLTCFRDVPLKRCWVFHLRHTCDVTETYRETSLRRRHDVATTSPRRLVVGWVVSFSLCIKLETQRIVDLLGDADNKSSKIAIWKWYVIND